MKVINISGVIGWNVDGASIRSELRGHENEDIRFEIASPGGFVYDGLEIFNLIKNHKGKTQTHIIGLAASMASYIALAGDEITAEENAVYMIHNVWNIGIGDHRELRKAADEAEQLTNLLSRAYAKKTGKKEAEIKALMNDESYFYGKEIKEAGFVDEVIEDKLDKNIVGNKDDLIIKAKATIKECFKILDKVESKENDLHKAAALLKNSLPLDKGKNNKVKNLPHIERELKNNRRDSMTLDELKKENPALYNQIKEEGLKEGVTQERKRVTAHLIYGERCGAVEFCHKYIREGKEANDQEVFAEYMTSGNSKKDLENLEKDNQGDLQPQNQLVKNIDEQAKELTGLVMDQSKIKKGVK